MDSKIETLENNSVKSGASSSSAKDKDSCHYNCNNNGGCTVRIQSQAPVDGNTMGSCFSEIFGGECFSTPVGCEKCLTKCKGRLGETFVEDI